MDIGKFDGPVEVDETYIGGKKGNKHEWKEQDAGRGPVGNAALVCIRDRDANRIAVKPVDNTDAATSQGERTNPETTVFTDEARAYDGLRRPHGRVKHSVNEFVNGMLHTNVLESHWALLIRGYIGVYHHFSRVAHRPVLERGRTQAQRPPDGHRGADDRLGARRSWQATAVRQHDRT